MALIKGWQAEGVRVALDDSGRYFRKLDGGKWEAFTPTTATTIMGETVIKDGFRVLKPLKPTPTWRLPNVRKS